MSDPRDRFRTLDQQDAPDLWSEATARSQDACNFAQARGRIGPVVHREGAHDEVEGGVLEGQGRNVADDERG